MTAHPHGKRVSAWLMRKSISSLPGLYATEKLGRSLETRLLLSACELVNHEDHLVTWHVTKPCTCCRKRNLLQTVQNA